MVEEKIRVSLLLENRFLRELLENYIRQNLSPAVEVSVNWKEADIVILGYNYITSNSEILDIVEEDKKLLILDYDFEEDELIILINLLPIKGVIYKDTSVNQLEKCLKVVNRGEIWIKRTTFEKLIKSNLAVSSLTPKEMLVVYYLLEGLTNKEIGRKMGITEQTVKHHINSILRKINKRNRIDIVLNFYRFKKLLKLILQRESLLAHA